LKIGQHKKCSVSYKYKYCEDAFISIYTNKFSSAVLFHVNTYSILN
jgi:hypothetical protein